MKANFSWKEEILVNNKFLKIQCLPSFCFASSKYASQEFLISVSKNKNWKSFSSGPSSLQTDTLYVELSTCAFGEDYSTHVQRNTQSIPGFWNFEVQIVQGCKESRYLNTCFRDVLRAWQCANWLAVKMTFPTWFNHLESFSYFQCTKGLLVCDN